MKRLMTAASLAAVIGASGGASAADLSSRASLKDEPVYAPAAIWTGYYVGGHIGALWGADNKLKVTEKCKSQEEEIPSVAAKKYTNCQQPPCWDCVDSETTKSEDGVSLLGGLHLGYNWQIQHRVLGVEADLSFADNIDYLASVRARLGYAQDNLLLYITGGIAFAGFQGDSITASNGTTFSVSDDSKIGFVVGAGAEYKLRPNWSIGLEGLYYAFGDDKAKAYDEDFCKEYQFAYERDNDLFVLRARLSYHFQDDRDAPLK